MIDIYTKYVWAVLVKCGGCETICREVKSILRPSGRKVNKIKVNKGLYDKMV